MQTPQDPVSSAPTDAKPLHPAQPAPRGWQVKFVVAPPQAMPTERLRARAELVRSALSCGGGFNCSSY